MTSSPMTPRERYLETIRFGSPDRVPFNPGGPREKTLKRWHTEGLPEHADWFSYLCEILEIKTPSPAMRSPGVDFRMIPTFEEKVLEHRDGHLIVQDWMGNITEISDEYDVTYIRNAKDFVTRKWHRFPVENRQDFEDIKRRYDPSDPGRYPDDFDTRVRRLQDRDQIVTFNFSGAFWQLREWCGFEPLCMLFLDDPSFVAEMIAFWTEFISHTMDRLLGTGIVDRMMINEDMAYKGRSMISPAMAREFLLPAWKRWVSEARAAGVAVIDMDSDGKIDELIPLWIEADIYATVPLEVAAGNDIVQYRRAFGAEMAFTGGVDKRCIAKGGKVIEAELERIAPIVRDGGYLPSCDHGVPFDISWPDFLHYAGRLAELTGWR